MSSTNEHSKQWIGGFAESNPAFAYPHPDLTSLDMLDNMDNIDKLERQMKILWPEFSWLTQLRDKDSRCFQMFAPDISRVGYTEEGRIYSIMCPQQGAYLKSVGINLNVEVTVTGQRGWVDEDSKSLLAADMTVTGKIWFSPNNDHPLLKLLFSACNDLDLPIDKAHAIEVETSNIGDTSSIFTLQRESTTRFESPDFAKHKEKAFGVGHIDVQINNLKDSGNDTVNKFNEIVLGIFNILSGNMLENGNILSWNVWFNRPEIVDQKEWRDHAKRWRESIDVDHRSPDGNGTQAQYYNGKFLKISELKVLEQLLKLIWKVLIPHAAEFGLNEKILLKMTESITVQMKNVILKEL